MTYLTVSEGYRAGGINVGSVCENPLPPGQNVCLTPDEVLIKPDTTTNYEVGLRSTWLDGALLFNAAVYYIDWNDVQVQGRSVNGGVPITVNGSSAESKGIELTTTWNITDAFQVAASYSYNDAKLSDDAAGLVDGADAEKGDRLAGSPQQQGVLLLGWTQPLTSGYTVSADYSMTAVGDVFTKVGLRNFGEALPGYAIHGLAVGLSAGAWSARLYADNLFDKYAITSVRRDRSYIYDIERQDGAIPSIPSRTYFQSPLRPRTIGLEFNYRFDL
jgi:outer membrane receptor protein involved in Fe transport